MRILSRSRVREKLLIRHGGGFSGKGKKQGHIFKIKNNVEMNGTAAALNTLVWVTLPDPHFQKWKNDAERWHFG